MADKAPENKAGEPTETKAPTKGDKAQEVFKMKTPDGRAYSTPDRAEAENLNRTRGYTFDKK